MHKAHPEPTPQNSLAKETPAPTINRRSIVKGAAWAVPTVAAVTAAPAFASSPGQYPYPDGAIYRNWSVGMVEEGPATSCTITIDAMTHNSTTSVSSPAAGGFWIDADTAGYGDIENLTFSLTSKVQNLTWAVTNTDGIGTWSYVGETKNGTSSTYTFQYSGPTKMEAHVSPGGADYAINRAAYTGFMAQSSSMPNCGGTRAWTQQTSATLWGKTSYSGKSTKRI